MNNTITLSTLPPSVLSQIPYSIKTFKDEYNIEELPFDIQDLIGDYLSNINDVNYRTVLDVTPYINEYGDFTPITNAYDIVKEYLKNYLLIQPSNYPFDSTFGSNLKKYIMMIDTSVKHKLISSELQRLVNVISSDLDLDIEVVNFDVSKSYQLGIEVQYECVINLRINQAESILKLRVNN